MELDYFDFGTLLALDVGTILHFDVGTEVGLGVDTALGLDIGTIMHFDVKVIRLDYSKLRVFTLSCISDRLVLHVSSLLLP